MGKAKKLAAAALTVLALVAVTATSVAQGGGEGVHVACQGGSGSTGCYG
jgi:protein-tyrosine phosphatase